MLATHSFLLQSSAAFLVTRKGSPRKEGLSWRAPPRPSVVFNLSDGQGPWALGCAGIGRILDQLEDSGLRDNTLIAFSCDNGFNGGHHGMCGQGNGTFPHNVYDSSVKVPDIFHGSGHISAKTVRAGLLPAYDVAATAVELAGLDGSGFDGSGFEQGPGQALAALLDPWLLENRAGTSLNRQLPAVMRHF